MEMLLSKDPTRTFRIRQRAVGEVLRRYKALIKLITSSFKDINFNTLNNSEKFNFNGYQFKTSEEFQREFLLWLEKTIDTVIFDNTTDAERFWMNEYIKQAYEQGISFTQAGLQSASPSIVAGQEFTATLSLSVSTTQKLSTPAHLDRTRLIYSRVFNDMKGVNATMVNQMRNVLADGLFEGIGAREVSKNLVNRVEKIGITRSKLIARTETVRANQMSVIIEGREQSKFLGIDVKYRWGTSTDERVRSTHRTRNNKIYEDDQIVKLVGEPNCRCRVFVIYDI